MLVELVGGPRDGEVLDVPGEQPPAHLRVIMQHPGGPLLIWHPATRGLPDMDDAVLLVLDLAHRGAGPGRTEWVYLWPHESTIRTD